MSEFPQHEQWKAIDPILGRPSFLQAHPIYANELTNETALQYRGDITRAQSERGNHVAEMMLCEFSDATLERGDVVTISRADYTIVKADGVAVGETGILMASPLDTDISGGITRWRAWVMVEGQTIAKVAATVTAGVPLFAVTATPGTVAEAGDAAIPGMYAVSDYAALNVELDAATALTADIPVGFAQVTIARGAL